MVEFGLPGTQTLEDDYPYLLNPPGRWAKKVTTVEIGDEEVKRIVKETEGFLGHAISKLAIAW